MAIFGVLQVEKVVQINDKTRLDASKSFTTPNESAVTLVEIEPESGSGFIDVTDSLQKNWYLDWSYSGTTREVTATLRITTDGAPVTFEETIQVNTEADDKLFSKDSDIVSKRPEVLKWLRPGRASFLDFHREARDQILGRLDDEGKTDQNGDRLTADAFVDTEEVRQIAAFWTLHLIFRSFSNAVGDVFDRDAEKYLGEVANKWNRAFLRYDRDGDGEISTQEGDYAFSAIRAIRE